MNLKRMYPLLAALLLALTGCGGVAATTTAAPTQSTATATAVSSLDYVTQFDKSSIMSVSITAKASDWQQMLDSAIEEQYIPCDITINGTTITNVGIRPKGNSSLSSIARDDTTDRYSFKIKFDEYVAGQTYLGLDKMVLNNNYADTTSMKEYLSYDIMTTIGVDTPLFCYADITVNGDSWGFYLAVEDVDSAFLDRTKDGEGELYKPDTMENMGDMGNPPDFGNGQQPPDATTNATPPQQPDGQGGGRGGDMKGADNGVALRYTDDNESSYSSIFDNAETKTDSADHQRVITALKALSAGTELDTYFDVDAILRYLAAHTVVVSLDSYAGTLGHNYYLSENNGQLSLLPWDYNMAFGGFQSASASDTVNFAIDTPVSGVSMEDRPLIDQLLAVPEYLETYHSYLQQLLDDYFADGQFTATVDKLNAMIGTHIKADPSAFNTYDAYQSGVTELKELGSLRAQSVQGQLDGTIPSTTDGQKADGSALVDASSVDMTKLGDMFGGKGGMMQPGGQGGPGGFQPPDGIDQETMRQAMDILMQARGNALTDAQQQQLKDLGLTDEQISQLQQMPGGGRR